MKPRKKRGFFNFLCAFMPGAAEMNMGFMKMGSSIMLAFLGSFALVVWLSLSDVFVIIPMILWFYGFFHARNLTTKNQLQHYLEYLYNENEVANGCDVIISVPSNYSSLTEMIEAALEQADISDITTFTVDYVYLGEYDLYIVYMRPVG